MTTYTNPTGNFSATEGDDTIIFNLSPSGTVTIDALGGNDGLLVNFSNPDALGFDVSDPLNTGSFNIAISGGYPGPRFFGYRFETVDLHGTAGDDSFSLQVRPNDSNLSVAFDGGAGNNRLHLDWTALTTGQSLILSGSTITSSLGAFANFGTFVVWAGSGSDTITMGGADDMIAGGGGNDTISAGEGVNNVSGGAGDDTISAGAGNDTLSGNAGNDVINAGDGADTIYGDDNVYSTVTDGADRIDGGTGNDSIYGGGGNDTLYGGDGNDSLTGGKGADYLEGGAGNDHLDGFGEYGYGSDDNLPDVLIAGAGDDTLTAGYGDTIDGGTGTDLLYYNALTATAGITADFSALTSGATITVGGATITGIEYIVGIVGTNYDDVLIAGAVKDPAGGFYIDGYGGSDTLIGTSGRDIIGGGDGDDVLIGGAGQDTLTGGIGADTFKGTIADFFNDSITSFDTGDKIIFTDANINTFSFTFDRGALYYSGGVLGISGEIPGRLVASAAAGGGVQISVEVLPVATIDQFANQLTSGYWSGDSHHWAVSQGGALTVDIHTLNASEQTLARAALQQWTDIIGVRFQEVANGAQIVFDHSEGSSGSVAQADASWFNGITSSAHIQISTSWVNRYGTSLNSYSFQTYIHEIGHALGLGHAGNYNVDAAYNVGALFANDGWPLSIMSYFDQSENRYFLNQGFSYAFAASPMQADIVAMQTLYGLSSTTRAGDTVYGYHSNAGVIYDAAMYPSAAFTIFDSGGNDTLDYSGFGGFQQINLNAVSFTRVNGQIGTVSIARGVVIENAIGGGGIDVIIGNAVANVLTGGASNDTLTGGGGDDVFKDTKAGHDGDTLTDFSRGDRIVITDASMAGFAYGLSGDRLTYSGGSLTLAGIHNASIAASAAPEGGVQITFSGPPLILAAGSSASSAMVAGATSQQADGGKAEMFASYDYPLATDHSAPANHTLISWAEGVRAFDPFAIA